MNTVAKGLRLPFSWASLRASNFQKHFTSRSTTHPSSPLSALRYIIFFALFLWLPLVIFVLEIHNPFSLFLSPINMAAVFMFLMGAIIANTTAVGGGMIFNPTLQLAFSIQGYSALALSILVQSAGMSSGAYGWYRKGEFQTIEKKSLILMALLTLGATVVWSFGLIQLMHLLPQFLPMSMKVASIGISFYVFKVVLERIQNRERHIQKLEEKAQTRELSGVLQEAHILEEIDHDPSMRKVYLVDHRIYPWILLGALLNTTTAAGTGELVFSHLIKYYHIPAKAAVAVGTFLQAISVLTQSVFIIIFLRYLLPLELLALGLLFCMIGGRMAPYILSHRAIEPYAKHILAMAALSMGVMSGIMLFI